MTWFKFIKEQGYFDPIKNPEPLSTKEGYQIPLWESLQYLEKLSIQIRNGSHTELADEIISIIRNVSEHPKDNYRTWYMLIKVLGNLPNDCIPKSILHYIPIWLKSRFDTMLQSSELIRKLLPKFLPQSPTKTDIQKAEIILHHLFTVERKVDQQNGIIESMTGRYDSLAYLHYLSEGLTNQELLSRIVIHCSNEPILFLGTTLKKLLLDYPEGIHSVFKVGEKEYPVKVIIDGHQLKIFSNMSEYDSEATTSTIFDYDLLDEIELNNALLGVLTKQGINYTPTTDFDDPIKRINFALNNDLFSTFGLTAIQNLGGKYYDKGNTSEVYALIFRDFLSEKAKHNPTEALFLLNQICFNRDFKIPFFKRIALYVVAIHWDSLKSFFWTLINHNAESGIFSTTKYYSELYFLLSENQERLSSEEKSRLLEIIKAGPKEQDIDDKYSDHWKLRWYSALRKIEPFNQKYSDLSALLNITGDHYENLGEFRFRKGNVSPLEVEDILTKSTAELAEYVCSFNPQDRWQEPTIDGLADSLQKAVIKEPKKFSDEIQFFNGLPYIYVYHILLGFKDAWTNQLHFNCENVLVFCKTYISDSRFYSEELTLNNDGWHATSDWVVGATANLLTEGLRNDENAFQIGLMPLVKELLKILVANLKYIEDFENTNMDYPTYSLNSTGGKVLRALLDYSLRRARMYSSHNNTERWEPEMKALFQSAIDKKILDSYILQGMYFEQFYFLDEIWISQRAVDNRTIEEKEWLAFIGGLTFGNPPFNKAVYDLLYPHYEKAIIEKIELKSNYNHGLIQHLTAFYLWGYEDLKSEKLLFKFTTGTKPELILNLVNFISSQHDYLKNLSESEKLEIETKVYDLWTFLANRLSNSTNPEDKKVLASLSNFASFVAELNEMNVALLLKSSGLLTEYYYEDRLLQNLSTLKEKGDPQKNAKYIGTILNTLPFKEYIHDPESDLIISLISFIYDHGQKGIANSICNKLSILGHEFLKSLYIKYN